MREPEKKGEKVSDVDMGVSSRVVTGRRWYAVVRSTEHGDEVRRVGPTWRWRAVWVADGYNLRLGPRGWPWKMTVETGAK